MLLGAFELHTSLASGGMGRVWHATHRPSGTPVAVKVLVRSDDPRFVRAFQEEVRAVARLRHPHVVALLDQGLVPPGGDLPAGAPWLAMELATGGSLRQRAAELDWTALRGVLDALLDALGYAHAHGILHRDVKPSNVLFTGDGTTLLADFGLGYAFASGDEAALAGGTLPYAAPEQGTADLPQGPWTDLYNLAATAWTLVTGRWPFGRDGRTPLHDLPRLVPRLAVPPDLEGWLHHLLAFDPERRFQRARDARAALAALSRAAGGMLVAPPDPETVDTAAAHAVATPPAPRWRPAPPPPPAPASVALEQPIGRPSGLTTGASLVALRRPPLVGRERERERLWHAVRALDGPHAIVISGPAGVGKSRLAEWAAARAHELAGAAVVRAGHQPERSAADGVLAAIGRVLGRTRNQRTRWLEVRAWPSEGLDEVLDLLDDRPVPRLATDRARHRVAIDVLRRLGPTVLVLDDAQWGPDALAFAAGLLASPLPVLVVVTVRDDLIARSPRTRALLDALGGEPMPVGPLPEEAREALVRAVLPTTPALTRHLAGRSAGNALFLVTLLDEARDRLEATTAGFAVPALDELRLPDSVVDIWRRRVDHLLGANHERRTALGAAAVLGHEVDLGEWARVCGELGVEADEAMFAELGAARLVHKTRERPGWAFAHGMLRESLVTPALHRAAAAALAAGGARETAGRVGRHLLAAGEIEAAVAPLADSVAYLGVMSRTTERSDVLDLLEAAVEQIGDPDRRVDVLRLRADLANQLHHVDELEAWLDRLLALDHGRYPAHVAWALKARAVVLSNAGRQSEALPLLERAVDLARGSGDPDAITLCTLELGRQRFVLGEHRSDLFEEAAAAAESIGAWPKVARAMTGLFFVACAEQRWDDAARHLDRQRVAAERSGPQIAAHYLENCATLARDQGALGRAVELLAEANDLLRRSGGANRAVVNEVAMGLLYAEQHRFDDAEALLAPALGAIRRFGLAHYELQALVGLLACRAHRASWDDARQALDEATARFPTVALDFLARDLRLARDLAAAAGRPDRAASLEVDSLLEARRERGQGGTLGSRIT